MPMDFDEIMATSATVKAVNILCQDPCIGILSFEFCNDLVPAVKVRPTEGFLYLWNVLPR